MPDNEFVVLQGFLDARPQFPTDDRPTRERGERITVTDGDRQKRWLEKGLIAHTGMGADFEEWPWGVPEGRDLSPLPDESHDYDRIVACLNVWHDLEELKENIETWYPYVDHVIAVDGAYDGVPTKVPWSTDGTVEFLKDLDKVEVVETEEFWEDQCVKRSVYLDRAEPGDLLWRIDADERYLHAENIRDLPFLDVGWIRYISPIYDRGQDIPTIFRYREDLYYEYRHHWLYEGDKRVKTNQRGGKDLVHRCVPIWFENGKGEKRPRLRKEAARRHRRMQMSEEAKRTPEEKQVQGREPLRIVHLGPIDPGAVIYRLHTAINATTPHESIMATAKQEYFQEPRQYDTKEDRSLIRQAAAEADIIHVHVNYSAWMNLGVRTDAPVIIHHHGTVFRRAPLARQQEDEIRADLRLVSNPELLTWEQDDLHFVPNPVPAKRYKRLADEMGPDWMDRPFRVAHSPTKREKKGTQEFLEAVSELQEEGLDIEPVLIENDTIQASLEKKAQSHACFDSFWLGGTQCSGLEAGAMGLPVIGGDRDVRQYYIQQDGQVPYTYANDKDGLKEVLRRLMEEWAFYQEEAEKMRSHVVERHDYPSVMDRYLDLLDETFNWRSRFTIPDRLPLQGDS